MKTTVSAARFVASIFGFLAGLGGILHGIGEVLQGNVAADSIVIESWTQGPIAAHMGGDPGMTILPNLLATGILAIVISLVLIVWAVWFVQKRHGGLVLLLLSIVLLLFGGGFGPPILGMLAGVGGVGINAPYTWWRTHLSVGLRAFLAKLWPWIFGVCALNGLFLVVGHIILVVFFAVTNAALFLFSFFFAVFSLPLSIFTGISYDIQKRESRE